MTPEEIAAQQVAKTTTAQQDPTLFENNPNPDLTLATDP